MNCSRIWKNNNMNTTGCENFQDISEQLPFNFDKVLTMSMEPITSMFFLIPSRGREVTNMFTHSQSSTDIIPLFRLTILYSVTVM